MKARTFALFIFIIGLLVSSYLCWASHRVSETVLFNEDGKTWPRPWPYPDQWLWHWNQRLDAVHPAPPGSLKLEGELPRIRLYLSCWTWLFVITTLCSFIWWQILRRRRRDA